MARVVGEDGRQPFNLQASSCAQFIVQMRVARAARTANSGQVLAACDAFSNFDLDAALLKMAEQAELAVAMVNDHVIAIELHG